MVLKSDLSSVLTHYWLKYRDIEYFHAYVDIKRGTAPVCKAYRPIGDLKEMDIPGDRSRCCNACISILYGFPRPKTEKETA